jgi:hypothetical protein
VLPGPDPRRSEAAVWPLASAALRSLVLVVIAMLLILVLLPAALGAVGSLATRIV